MMQRSVLLFLLLWGLSAGAFAGLSWETVSEFGDRPSRAGGEFYYPSGVAVNSSNGEVIVADSQNQQIQRFTADGIFLNKWNFSGGIGLTVDPVDDSIYIGSVIDHKMYKFDPLGNQLAVWGGKGTGNGQFDKPRHVTVNPITRNVFVLDSVNRRVQEFTPQGVFVQSWAPDLALWNPYGIDIDPTGSFVWIANTGTLQDMVRKYDLNGNLLLSFGTVGSAPGFFRWPRGMAVDASGNPFIADTDMERVQKYDADGNFQQVFMGPENDIDGPAHPRAIAVNRTTGDIYTAAAYSNRIDRFDASGTFIQSWGHHDRDGLFLTTPKGITVDPVNSVLYVADTPNHLIKKFTLDGTFLGQYGNWPFVYRDETAVAFPAAVSTDAAGNYWALNEGIIYPDDPTWGSDKFVRQFDSNGTYLSGFAHPDFTAEMGGIAVNRTANEIYVSNTRKHKIMRFDFSGTLLGEWGVKGFGEGQFNSPAGIALDVERNYIAVVDAGNYRIQKFTLDGTFISAFGSAGSAQGRFFFADYSSLVFDDLGYLYVADTGNHRVQVFDSSNQFVEQIGGLGKGPGLFKSPVAVTAVNDLLFVLETSNREVEIIRITPGSRIGFDASSYSVSETGNSATITVTRTDGVGAVSMDYATSAASATPGSDYTETSGTLNFADGVTSLTFAVPVLDDQDFEGDETVNLALSNPVGIELGAAVSAVLTITEPEAPVDSNDDGLSDADVVALGLDPNDPDGDTDNDGLSDVEEAGGDASNPLPIDSDSDGVIDALEPGVAADNATVADGLRLSGGEIITITSEGGLLSNVSVAEVSAGAGPDGVNFPFGMLSYTVSSAVGGSVRVQVAFSADLPESLVMYKVDNAGKFTELTATVWTQIDARTIELILTDGDPVTDQDGTVNGSIDDPVAPGGITSASSSGASTVNASSGGGGGGCTVSAGSGVDPIWLFMLMVSGFGYMRRSFAIN